MTTDRIEKNLIRATYRITTPMFCGGAEQQAEFRLPSFKGILRFWWRALEWGRMRNLEQLHREESELFGSSNGGQAKFLMRLSQSPVAIAIGKKTQLKDGGVVVGEGARYLGYGVMEAYASHKKGTKDAELTRQCLAAPDCFELTLRFGSGSTGTQQQQVIAALKLVGMLGGIGGKSRKGYGSLTLTTLTANESPLWAVPDTFDEFRNSLRPLISKLRTENLNAELPSPHSSPLTAFTSGFRIVAIEGRTAESALRLLDRIGCEMVRYRSWGREGKVLRTIDSEKNFQPDHDLMKQDSRQRITHPRRVAFGLPHNYGPKSQDHVEPVAEKLDRRASPLFIHIHQPEGSPPIGVLIFLPGMFLPQGRDAISVGGKPVDLVTNDLWKPVTGFLDRLLDRSTRKEFSVSDRIEEVARG